MKKTVSRQAEGGKTEFIRARLDPVNGKKAPIFGPLDAVMIAALVIGSIMVMRFLIGH